MSHCFACGQREDVRLCNKVRDDEAVIASARGRPHAAGRQRAPRNSNRDLIELLCPFGLTDLNVTRF